eukprot:6809875-Alexandrium_andersonii.AAC.1
MDTSATGHVGAHGARRSTVLGLLTKNLNRFNDRRGRRHWRMLRPSQVVNFPGWRARTARE